MHPKYKTPSFSTILTGLVVGIPAVFMNLTVVVDLTSVGTLFAFVLVCGGIIKLQHDPHRLESKFKTPYVNAKWIVPGMLLVAVLLLGKYYPGGFAAAFSAAGKDGLVTWKSVSAKVPFWSFSLVFLITAVLSFVRSYSLIPVLGFLCCAYLLSESGVSNWERFLVWLVAGLLVYFFYGSRNSKLLKMEQAANE
jgi:amino acid transporter